MAVMGGCDRIEEYTERERGGWVLQVASTYCHQTQNQKSSLAPCASFGSSLALHERRSGFTLLVQAFMSPCNVITRSLQKG